jgi:hypothetical protein
MAWAAERRSFVAFEREQTADARDEIADRRDETADEREGAADARDRVVGPETLRTLCDLLILANQAAEPVPPSDARRLARRALGERS